MTSDLLLLSAGDEFSRSPRYELIVRGVLRLTDFQMKLLPKRRSLFQLYPSLSVAATECSNLAEGTGSF
jgi:hypothetical protein